MGEEEQQQPKQLDLALTVLDHELVDVEGSRCGRVDDLELEGEPGKPLTVQAIVAGPRPWRVRGGWLGRLVSRLYPGDEVTVPWSQVEEVTAVVKLRKRNSELGLGAGDERARPWLERLPGS